MSTLQNLSQYGNSFQTQVISALLTHKEFLININDILTPEYFDSTSNQWIVGEILRYYNKYHCNISMNILRVELKKIDNEVLQVAIKEQLREAYRTSEEDLKYVEEEFSNFCKNQQLKKALLTSVDFLNDGDYDSIRTMIDNALRAGQDKNLGHEYEKDIEYRYREDNRRPIPTPWPELNTLLQGGIGEGDLGLFFGGPGSGKSWSLVAIGSHAIKLGYNVLHYTLELGDDYMGRRYDSHLSQIPVQDVLSNKETVEAAISPLTGRLIIKEYPMGKTHINSIESHIKKCIELDFKPDLIIIDYIDLLKSKRKGGDRKEEIDDIYVSTKGLAKQLKLPIWSVSQVNRAGAKDNVVEGDKAAGSYEKMAIADMSISLSRKKEDKVNGTGRFHIMKNRYGEDGMTYNVSIDTSMGNFEILGKYEDDDELPEGNNTYKSNGTINNLERTKLKQKFYELSN